MEDEPAHCEEMINNLNKEIDRWTRLKEQAEKKREDSFCEIFERYAEIIKVNIGCEFDEEKWLKPSAIRSGIPADVLLAEMRKRLREQRKKEVKK